jgi:hypothetical protein
LESVEAQQLRVNTAIKNMRSATAEIVSGGLKDFKNALMQGATAFEALKTAAGNALNKISDKLIDMATQQLVNKAFGGLGGSSSGGLGIIGAALGIKMPSSGGGGDKGVEVVNASDMNRMDEAALNSGPSFLDLQNMRIEGAFRRGGLVGQGGTPTWVHPAYFENAPHMAGGGMITDGGIPIIAHPGERVLSPSETKSYGSGGGVSIGGTTVVVQGDASEKTVALIDQRIAARNREIPGLVVKTMQDARSRNVSGMR